MNFWQFVLSSTDWWSRIGLEYPNVWIPVFPAIFAFGACIGSFLNVCIWRMPRGESVVTAPSHCTTCGQLIHWYDNIPVVSYLVLRGRCRRCGAPYSSRYFWIEVLTGLLFVAVVVYAGLAQLPPGAVGIGFWTVMLAIPTAWIDCKFRIIPDGLTYPTMVFALLLHSLVPETSGNALWYQGALFALISGLGVGLFLAAFAWLGRRWTGREVLGWGDVKFMIAAAMLFGVPGALFTLLIGSLLGTAAGLVLALKRHKKLRRYTIAFGPFLAVAAVIWFFGGKYLVQLMN